MVLNRAYEPPTLTRRIILRTAGIPNRNDYGRVIESNSNDKKVWAHRYDRRVLERDEDGAELHSIYTTFTIRSRGGVDENTIVIHKGKEYSLVGPPIERGGDGLGPAERYLQLVCIGLGSQVEHVVAGSDLTWPDVGFIVWPTGIEIVWPGLARN